MTRCSFTTSDSGPFSHLGERLCSVPAHRQCAVRQRVRETVFNANSNSNSDSNLKCRENQLNKRVLAGSGTDGTAIKHTEKCWSVLGGNFYIL